MEEESEENWYEGEADITGDVDECIQWEVLNEDLAWMGFLEKLI